MKDLHLLARGLTKHFPGNRGLLQRAAPSVRAVDGVDLELARGQTLALVGESGSGKTTVGQCLLRLIEPDAGQLLYYPDPAQEPLDLRALDANGMRRARSELQFLFQDPYSSLNPRLSVGDAIAEALLVHGMASGSDVSDAVAASLTRVGLGPELERRFPQSLSGGQRQRVGIARALAPGPKLLVCDEPVSALDVSIQAQILNLLKDLQDELSLTYLFISHDLSIVRSQSERVAVMYLGRIIEEAPVADLFDRPQHPYTQSLLSAIPRIRPGHRRSRVVLGGDVPSSSKPPSGCFFHPRCPQAEARCSQDYPDMRAAGSDHRVACHLIEGASNET